MLEITAERIKEAKRQVRFFVELVPYMRMSKSKMGELSRLAFFIPPDLWREWLTDLAENKPKGETFEYWRGGLTARLQEQNGEIFKRGTQSDMGKIGTVLANIIGGKK